MCSKLSFYKDSKKAMLPLEIKELIVQHSYHCQFQQLLQELQQKVCLTNWRPMYNQTWLWVDEDRQWSRSKIPHTDERMAYNWVAMDVDWGLWDYGSVRDSIAISAQVQKDQHCYLFRNSCYNKHYHKVYYGRRSAKQSELYITRGYSSYFFDKWEEDRWKDEELYEQHYH